MRVYCNDGVIPEEAYSYIKNFEFKECGSGDLKCRASIFIDDDPGIVIYNEYGIASGWFKINHCPLCGKKLRS